MKKSALLCIIIASVCWGTSGIFVHYLSPYGFTSIQMTFIRSLIMFVALFGYVLMFDRKLLKVSLPDALLIMGSGLSFFGTATCYFYAMTKTSVSTAVVLMYTAPIYIMIYSVMFLGEKLTKQKLISATGMLLGCLFVSGIIGGFKFDSVGIGFGILSGISYSAYNILTKIEMKRGISPVTANLYGFLFAAVIGATICDMDTIALCFKGNSSVVFPLVLAMGVFTAAMPYLCYSTALKSIPAGTASSLSVLEPMAATVFSVAFLGESLSPVATAGIILILGSVFLLSRQKEN